VSQSIRIWLPAEEDGRFQWENKVTMKLLTKILTKLDN